MTVKRHEIKRVCSEQTEHGREQTHREMMQTVQEMKKRLPSEKRMRSKASTVEALNYALNCVKQVQGKHTHTHSKHKATRVYSGSTRSDPPLNVCGYVTLRLLRLQEGRVRVRTARC